MSKTVESRSRFSSRTYEMGNSSQPQIRFERDRPGKRHSTSSPRFTYTSWCLVTYTQEKGLYPPLATECDCGPPRSRGFFKAQRLGGRIRGAGLEMRSRKRVVTCTDVTERGTVVFHKLLGSVLFTNPFRLNSLDPDPYSYM